MTEAKPLPVPLKRYSDAYRLELNDMKPFARWRRDAHWNYAYKEADEGRLDEPRLRVIDLFNAFMYYTDTSEKIKSIYYRRVARKIFHVEDESVLLWERVLQKEFQIAKNSTTTDEWKSMRFFHKFVDLFDLTRYSDEYSRDTDDAKYISNAIRLVGAKDRSGAPLVFDTRNVKLLLPHFNLHHELAPRDLLEAEGVLKLQHAWKTTNDEEKQKIKRFVAAHAEEIDAALLIIDSRFVNTLEQLESFMEQAGSTSALMDGAL